MSIYWIFFADDYNSSYCERDGFTGEIALQEGDVEMEKIREAESRRAEKGQAENPQSKDSRQNRTSAGGQKSRPGTSVAVLLALTAVFALHCKFEMVAIQPQESALVNGLHKLYLTFSSPEFTDLFVFAAVYVMLRFVRGKEKKADGVFLVSALVLSATLIVSISYKKFNSAAFLLANSYQAVISCFCIAGFCIILYGLLCCIYHFLRRETGGTAGREKTAFQVFAEKHFLWVSAGMIFAGWLPWIVMNYPGSGCPDGISQLQQFLGEKDWGAGHPPLSTLIMGGLFSLGSRMADANLGFFLYCFVQTCVGAAVFSLSMKKLKDLGISVRWCLAGTAWFAFTPFWGTYAQWVEKDLLYAEVALLQTISMLEILVRRECGRREMLFLTGSSLGAVFLRNNGIYAVLPALILLAVRFRGISRRRIFVSSLIVLLSWVSVTEGLYPVLGVRKISPVEGLSIPFQQTGRYVCEHGGEVTKQEREVLDAVFGYENLSHYDPVISDPIKIHCRGVNMGEYLRVWAGMFRKHPGTYLAAFLNKSYGYLAPVSQNIEAWIQLKYDDYLEGLGIYHVLAPECSDVLVTIWNMSMTLPLVKYLCTPGLYTWIAAVLALFLARERKYGALILFVPSFMNILVCLASPLAGAIRYELPTVASTPLLIGWTYFSLHEREIPY